MRWIKRLLNKHLIKRRFLFWWQRRTRGWDDSETWSMDYSLSKVIVKKLRIYQEINHINSFGPFEMTSKEWEDKISEMIWGFQWFADGKQYTYTPPTIDERETFKNNGVIDEAERAHDAIELFTKHYKHLWKSIPIAWGSSTFVTAKYHLAEIILPRLQRFQELHIGYPHNMSPEEWNDILSKMIWGFQWYAARGKYAIDSQEEPENVARAHTAIELFGKFFGHLWW